MVPESCAVGFCPRNIKPGGQTIPDNAKTASSKVVTRKRLGFMTLKKSIKHINFYGVARSSLHRRFPCRRAMQQSSNSVPVNNRIADTEIESAGAESFISAR